MADLNPDAALSVSNLRVAFESPHGLVRAVNGVSFSIRRGETVGILGESGSGKSVSVGAVMGLLDSPPARVAGEIRFRGADLLRAPARKTRRIRGNRISMVFQDAVTALNPGLTVGYQLGEMFRIHRPGTSRRDATRRAVELMDRVGIPSARQRVHGYPHELSGGMSQRIMIAMAIALEPDVLIADEPTTALDVTVQAQVFDLLKELQERTGAAIILISHDMGAIAEMADRVMVMYAGRTVEEAPTDEILDGPRHPYTKGLIACVPHLEEAPPPVRAALTEISGVVPALTDLAAGCSFAPRCAHATDRCRRAAPPTRDVGGRHRVACWLYEEADAA